MSETVTLTAAARDRVGKGASRALRRTGRVPAVIYGAGQPPAAIHIEEKALVKALETGHFMTTVFAIEHPGGTERAIPKDVQFNVVTDRPEHVDFLRVAADSRLRVMVPVRVVDEDASPGVRRGGVVGLVRHEVELWVSADAIPEELVVSVKGLDVGESVHISAVTLPEGATPVITDRDFTIAAIAAPSGLKAEEAAAAEAGA
ncbi:MAG: 50S ribosomal protein L25/general stress protein Ctc [Sphingomonadaceae bacterium]